MIKNTFRKIIQRIHLWLGLTTGVIVFIVCITGSIYTFQKELKTLIHSHYSVDIPTESIKLPLENIVNSYKKHSNHVIRRLYDFKKPSRSIILLTVKDKEYYYSYMNPYTGELLKETPLSKDFFTVILYLHRNLLLGKIGTQIIGYSIIIFIISLISGLILWFPKNKKIFKNAKGRKSQFSIKTNAPKKKLTYNLHKVLGFYGASILIVLAITGITWTFNWVDNMLYMAVTFEKKQVEKKITILETPFKEQALDVLKKEIIHQRVNKDLFIYYFPNTNKAPLRVLNSSDVDEYGDSDIYYANPDNGTIIGSKLDEEKNAGQKLKSLYYDIHTGSLLGLGGKTLVFLAGLIGASLPITGFFLYLNRRKKSRYIK
ncbi:PepSY-associated TM helix domain-containing protein [Aquimarina muelleri]|uniref:PepSY-associated TM helix domain-containing protein n=1 Tax=Aquimarina muelleri TaxID=279356 RepID=UPI003F687D96